MSRKIILGATCQISTYWRDWSKITKKRKTRIATFLACFKCSLLGITFFDFSPYITKNKNKKNNNNKIICDRVKRKKKEKKKQN